MEHLVWGTFGEEVQLIRRRVRPSDSVATNDTRLRFFLVDRLRPIPRTCAGLAGRSLLVMLVSGEAGQQLALDRTPPPASWDACTRPRTTRVADFPGQFVAFSVGAA
jgi:hypothetical protein